MDIPSIILLVMIVAVVAMLLMVYRRQRLHHVATHAAEAACTDEDCYLQAMQRDYGMPDEVVSVHTFGSPTYDVPLLFYTDFVVLKGRKFEAQDIAEVTFNNRSNPYTTNDYQVVVALTDGEHLSIAIGNDIDKAKYVVQQLNNFLLAHRQ